MNNLCDIANCTGTAIIEWEQMILAEVPKEERVDYVIKYGHILRKQYCSEVCSVTKFDKKYHSHWKNNCGDSPTHQQGSISNPEEGKVSKEHKRAYSNDIYIFEGGINDNT
jgi:hypothetical protein